MGKMFNTLLISGMVSIVLLLLDGSGGALGVIAKLFLAPQTSWGSFFSDAFNLALTGATLLGGALVIGSIVFKQDWLFRAGMFTVLVSWIEAPLIDLWQFMGGKILTTSSCSDATSYICSQFASGATTGGMIIAGILIGPVILYGIWACWSYIWSPESSG